MPELTLDDEPASHCGGYRRRLGDVRAEGQGLACRRDARDGASLSHVHDRR